MSDFWLNCDSCGRQNVGVTFVNGMRFCAKCYQETFGNTNAFEKELRDEIKVLEKALELACEQIWAMSIWENTKEEVIQDNMKFFKDKAKDVMKSE